MNKDKETLATWNNLARLYEEKFMDLNLYNDTYDLICSPDIRSKAGVLDIGCGPGNIIRYLLAKRPDFQALGIDTSPEMLEIARRHNPTARFLRMDAREISQLQETFDIIISGFCLPYLSPQERKTLISQSGMLLNAIGLIYLSFVEGHSADSVFKESIGGRVYFQYHELEEVLSDLKNAGFGDIRTYKVKYPKNETETDEHTIIIARKITA